MFLLIVVFLGIDLGIIWIMVVMVVPNDFECGWFGILFVLMLEDGVFMFLVILFESDELLVG